MPELRIDAGSVRLLLIDGDAARSRALAGALSASGYGTVDERSPAAAGADRLAAMYDVALLELDDPSVTAESIAALRDELGCPLLGITSDATTAGRRRAAALGVNDFVCRPLEELEVRLRIDNALAGGRLRRLLNDRSARLTEALRERTTELDTVRESLSVLAAMADYHDDDTDQHAQRVGAVAAAIATGLGLPEAQVTMLRAAAPLHDIGKVGISRRILLKPGKLTEAEWVHMQRHVEIGAEILASSRSEVLILAAEIARTHHERFDGTGYTSGLSGDQIPLSGRIVSVADVWDTLTHDRPYRKAWTTDAALEEILTHAGTQFDPRVVEAFATLSPEALRPAGVERAA